MDKRGLIECALRELRAAQHKKWLPPKDEPVKRISFPPVLPTQGDGNLFVTEDLLECVAEYARIIADVDPILKARFKTAELKQLTAQAFGDALHQADLSRPDAAIVEEVTSSIDQAIALRTKLDSDSAEITFGCYLFRGDEMYPLRVGAVLFETREQWRTRSVKAGRLSSVTSRRLEQLWAGRPLRKRQRSFDELTEQSIIDVVGDCSVICSVETAGLSSKMMGEKSALAARLAMTALSLPWGHPSEGLRWMRLKYDGVPYHRAYAVFTDNRYAGSSSSMSKLGSGRWTDKELIAEIERYRPLFDVLAESITRFVQPATPTNRPRLNNSIFLSLWWLEAGCREEADQIATAKFVSSMDALVNGQGAHAIMKFLKARGNYDSDSSLMVDGRTTKSVLNELYSLRRSQLLHGSSVDFAQDWSSARSTAEAVARLCLVLACAWMEKHPNDDDLKALSR